MILVLTLLSQLQAPPAPVPACAPLPGESTAWSVPASDWSSPNCALAMPALRHLAEEADAHFSSATQAWARQAVADRAVTCHRFLPLSWTPALTPSRQNPTTADSWRWLADVGARREALALIAEALQDPHPHWSWAFAWVELSGDECPTLTAATRHQCRGLRALREGAWTTLLSLLQQAPVASPQDDAMLAVVALEALGRHPEAKARALSADRSVAFAAHPLTLLLDAVTRRERTDRPWNAPHPAADALEPGHALRRLLSAPPSRVPMPDEAFTSPLGW